MCYNQDMSNAVEFISAYNTIDARMRVNYRGKGNLQFSDLVRRCAQFHKTIRKYEEDLLLCARLRNVIVHESRKDRIIAEPCDELTLLICHVAELLQSPPRLSALKEKKVACLNADATVAEAIETISRTNFSNIPVYRGKRLVGVINNRRIVRVIGQTLQQGGAVEDCLHFPCSDVLHEDDMIRFYRVLGRQNDVQDAIEAFESNRKLLAVLVTNSGNPDGEIVNLLTSADLPMLIRLLEE